MTSSHRSWRSRAGVLRNATAATTAPTTSSTIFASAGTGAKSTLPPLALGAPNQIAETIQVPLGESLRRHLEERRHRARTGSTEEGAHEMLEGAALGIAL